MTKKELQKRIAQMESYVDQVETEMAYVDSLLHLVGFADGLKSLKSAAMELLNRTEKEKERFGTS